MVTFFRAGWTSGVLLSLVTSAGCGAITLREGERPPGGGPPPIVLISIDTLRPDRVGAYSPRTSTLTPNLDAFADEAVVFDHAYSQAIQTAPSHASVFTSVYPSEQTGADNQTVLDASHPTMAQVLEAYGYKTGAFVAGGDLSPHRRLNRGFGVYESPRDFGSFYHTTPRAMAWLDHIDLSSPYFMFVHSYDVHSIYLKPTPFGYLHADVTYDGAGQVAARTATERVINGFMYPDFDGLLDAQVNLLRPWAAASKAEVAWKLSTGEVPIPVTPRDLEHVGQMYDGAVSYADAMFGALMAGIEQRGQLDRAIIIVMSDHGEQLGEQGIFGHCCGIGDEETHAVMMVRLPRGEHGGRHVGGFVELLDVLPTVADLVGARAPADIDGRSFAAAVRDEPFQGRPYAHSEGSQLYRVVSVRGPEGRLTYAGLPPSSAHLPGIVAAARLDGPGFLASAGLAPEGRRALREEMVGWLKSLTPPPDARSAPLPDSLRRSLREHGYFEVAE